MLTGVAALAQLSASMNRSLSRRATCIQQTGPARSYRRVAGNDPSGDAGWMTPLIFPDEESCRAFVKAVRSRGIRHVTTARELFAGGEIEHCYSAMSADRYLPMTGAHWASEFRAMIGHVSIDPRIDPWSHAPERNYPDGFMDQIDTQAVAGATNPRLEPVHCETCTGTRQGGCRGGQIFGEPVGNN